MAGNTSGTGGGSRHRSKSVGLAGSLALLLAAAAAAEPAAPQGAPEPPEEAVVGVLPFEPSRERNRVLVNLAPEGQRPFVLMLDTAASDSVITPQRAKALGVTVRRVKSDPYVRPTRLGKDLRFWVDAQWSDTTSKTGWEYGLLGGEFMNDFVVEIDFPGRRVRFLDPERYQVPESADAPDESVVPLRLGGKRISTQIALGDQSAYVMLGTGVPYSVILSGQAAEALGIDVAGLPDFGTGGTTVGEMKLRLHETERFSFAGFRFGVMPVLVAPRGWYNVAGPTDSALGIDVLRQFVVRIDYPRRRLWLKRSGDPKPTFLGVDYELMRRSGAFLVGYAGSYRVVRVLPDTPAAKLGVRRGDLVAELLDQERSDIEEVVERIAAGKPIEVSRRVNDVWVDVTLPEDEWLPEVTADEE
jgi:hypothetical protein